MTDRATGPVAEHRPRRVAQLLEAATGGLDGLAALGEQVGDELQYVNDLATVYRGRLALVAAERGLEVASPAVGRAVDVALEEAALVEDPHRAIDWLSTLPQVVLLAIGESA